MAVRGRGLRRRYEPARPGVCCWAGLVGARPLVSIEPLSSERQHQSRTEAGPEGGERPRAAEAL